MGSRNCIWLLVAAGILFSCLSACNDRGVQQNKKSEAFRTLLEIETPLPIPERPKILVLHSYDPDDSMFKEAERGILKGFAEEGFIPYKNLTIDFLPIPTVIQSSRKQTGEVVEQVSQRINELQPQIVLVAGNVFDRNAFDKFIETGRKFVFLTDEGTPGSEFISLGRADIENVSTVFERFHIERTIRLLRYLAPELRKIAVISDDSEKGAEVIKRVSAMAEGLNIEVVASSSAAGFDQWKSFVASVQNKADALLVASFDNIYDERGLHVPGVSVIGWTVRHSRLPDAGLITEAVKSGLMCSEAVSLYRQGFLAATIASYVLMGQSPGEYSLEHPKYGVLHINLDRTAMLEVDIPMNLQRIAVFHRSLN